MPKNIDFFIKNEASYSIPDKNFGDYLGRGVKLQSPSGTYEGMFAVKFNKESEGVFTELKYTTPKFLKDFAFESRSRLQYESVGSSFNTRLAAKYSKNLNSKFNIYEIAGSTLKIPFKGDKKTTFSSLTGIGYNINSNINIYAEGEISKTYNLKKNEWGKYSPAIYLGIKYTF